MASRTSKQPTTPDITELLHEDHQKVRNLFFDFTAAETGAEKEKLVKQILTELFVHATVEEEIVYPAVAEDAEEGEDLVDEAETEHLMVKHLMAELSEMNAGDDRFEAKMTVLCELVEHHVREEEKEMFKNLRESDADLEEISEQVVARKQELMGKPLPKMESSLTVGKQAKSASVRANGKARATAGRSA